MKQPTSISGLSYNQVQQALKWVAEYKPELKTVGEVKAAAIEYWNEYFRTEKGLAGDTSTQEGVDNLRNVMARGNYPLSISDCEVTGINGNCGKDCIVYKRGECENPSPEWEATND